MTEEKLQFANILKRKIDKLDEEVHDLAKIMPPIRNASPEFDKSRRGYFKRIINRKLRIRECSIIEVELSNEDIMALIEMRHSEMEALKQVLRELE